MLVLWTALGCGDGTGRETTGGRSEIQDAPKAAGPEPALIVWTTIDPLDAAAKAAEDFVILYNKENPTRPAALRYFSEGEFSPSISRLEEEELPPDFFLLSGAQTIELARRGFLRPLDELIDRAKIDRDLLYPAARRTVTDDGRQWGLPLCAEMTLTYVNFDRADGTTATEGDWPLFLEGKRNRCRASSDHLMELILGKPSFSWKVIAPPDPGASRPKPRQGDLPREAEKKDNGNALRTLALSVSSKSPKPLERFFPLMRLSQEPGTRPSQEPGTASLFWKQASKLPVHRLQKIPEFVEGPWIDTWTEGEK